MGFFDAIGDFFSGTPAKRENVSTLRKEQEPLYQQLQKAGMQKGAGGAFGDVADYYRSNLSDNPADLQAFAAPELRQFNEQTIPGLTEQFAGMGSGGLSSSGFRNAAVGAGADLSERLGMLRAQLRQNSAAGLNQIGQQGLQNFSQNMETQAASPGFLSNIAPAVGGAIGTALGGAFGGGSVGKNSSPYGKMQGQANSIQNASNYNPLSRG